MEGGGGDMGSVSENELGGGGGGGRERDRHNHTNLKRHSTRIFTMLKPGVAGKFLNRLDK